jgi:hypothetical protein
MKRWVAGLLTAVFVAGCSSIPFQETTHVSMGSAEPGAIVEHFKGSIPESFQMLSTVVFQYNWDKLSGIGYIDINTREKVFTVVCINPMGFKLFELSGDKDGVVSHHALEELAKKGNVGAAVGEDIKRIYFDLVPSPEAEVIKKKYQIVFRQPFGVGIIEYIFAGADGYLIEKSYYEEGTRIWQVSFYEYLQKNGKAYPGGIVLKNCKYGYSLIIKQKEILN